jgi:hypothetical protein
MDLALSPDSRKMGFGVWTVFLFFRLLPLSSISSEEDLDDSLQHNAVAGCDAVGCIAVYCKENSLFYPRESLEILFHSFSPWVYAGKCHGSVFAISGADVFFFFFAIQLWL